MKKTAIAADLSETAAWYGKLSSLGDFAQRRIPAELFPAFDTWLSTAMRDGREQLGERWLDVYLTTPMQRFAWAPGVIDEHWWFGLFMPSCDSVGRYFPLLIAQPREGAPQDGAALGQLERWYEHLVAAAMRTLDERGTPVEALEEALRESPAWASAPGRDDDDVAAAIRPPGRRTLAPGAELSHWLPALATQSLLDALAGCSLWWPVGGEDEPATLRIVRGLPWDEDFVALLEGH